MAITISFNQLVNFFTLYLVFFNFMILWISSIVLSPILSILAIVISKLLYKLLRIIIIVIVSNKLHSAIIVAFNYLQKKHILRNISTISLLYLFDLCIWEQLRIFSKIKYMTFWLTFEQILLNIFPIFFVLSISIILKAI